MGIHGGFKVFAYLYVHGVEGENFYGRQGKNWQELPPQYDGIQGGGYFWYHVVLLSCHPP